jgi:hypothetical protein
MSFQTSSLLSATTLAGQVSIPSQSLQAYENAFGMVIVPFAFSSRIALSRRLTKSVDQGETSTVLLEVMEKAASGLFRHSVRAFSKSRQRPQCVEAV